jgi:hypothetical protein
MPNKSKLALILSSIFFALFLISFSQAACTLTLDKTSYIAGETATAAMTCSANGEKNKAYTLNWTNQTGALFETDTGTTPAVKNQLFYQSYSIPSGWPNGVFLNASLLGDSLTVTQNDSANVTASASAPANSLLITNATFGGGYIGLVSSVKATVKDENSKKITGGFCKISAWSNDETRMLMYQDTRIVDGDVKVAEILPPTRFAEGTDYAYKILCYCGTAGAGTECIDEDGAYVNNSITSAKGFFTTSTWLTVNTVTDKSVYAPKQEIFLCANVTNVNYSSRIPMEIYHQVRCSSGVDNDADRDRALIASDDGFPDDRGISFNSTQMQCKRFIIPESKYLQGRNSECYASTETWVLDNSREKTIGYFTTSPLFNITSDELNLNPDWQRLSGQTYNAVVNLSADSYANYNATGNGNIDLRLSSTYPESIDPYEQYKGGSAQIAGLLDARYIKNYSGVDIDGNALTINFEILDDGFIELELVNVSLNQSAWYNITLNLETFEDRQTTALEGINTKTGTFHMSVDCPAESQVGATMPCLITAQVEDSQTV